MDLKEPRNAYLELLDQPEKRIVYTLREETASRYKTPKELSDRTKPGPKGITAQLIRAKDREKMGARRKMTVLA